MEIAVCELPSTDCTLWMAGDLHYGSLNCSRSSIRQMVDDIMADDTSLLCLLGDQLESITPQDKRWQTTSIAWQDKLYTPEQQAKAVVEDFKPLKGRIPVVLAGNHEWKLANICNFGEMIADGLGAEYGSAACVVHWKHNGKVVFRTHLMHGGYTPTSNAKDPVQADANVRASLKLRMQDMVGDCVAHFCGHGHRLIVQTPTASNHLYITTTPSGKIKQNYKVEAKQDADYIPPDSRWYGMVGSFLKLYSPPGSKAIGYAEMFGYRPNEIGCLKATVRNSQIVNVEKVVY